ncbi:glycosyltransferase [Flavobacterium sp. GT3R68]|uniref:glycosyltransferase n=1 Tax=Flavobacterium sp. GT3R68 TaxID=2594437 RepID=UPI000F860A20|nr:glycosyltransferase [Flavobacterium sp. GT3R68]RTY92302.1 glycosyltransferase [Flavobacterium sp. GSN2]TRW92538.1 glycosyltransferase [Flavobacterium sp. GT3R68]
MNSPKKELLFIINNLNCGGAEKSVISLLQTIDYSKFNIDLYLFKHEGLFLKQIPAEVTLLPEPEQYHYFDMSIKKAVIENLKAGKLKLVWYRILAGLIYSTEKIPALREQKAWKYLKKVLPKLNKKYDVAIGFLEKMPNYFCVDNVIAKRKIGYVMNDYEKLMMDKTIDNYYFSKLNFIVSDSNESRAILIRNFPHFEDKFKVLKNIISPSIIDKLCQYHVSDFPEGFKLLSVGRLTHQKGYDLAIRACKILADKGYQFKWYILGKGEDQEELKALIDENQLNDFFVFLGIKENHYPYLQQADIFVHTARFEGFGIVISEAKILKKPIVLSDFNVARNHIKHNYNGLIADLDPESIAHNIEILMNNAELRTEFSENLAKEDFGTESEINNFYKIIDN